MKNPFNIKIMEPGYLELTEQQPEILLIEDNDDDAEIVSSIFEKNNMNHTICRMRNGEDALDYLFQKGKYSNDSKSKIPRIVLLDINLPKLNGIDVLRRMRAQPRTKNIPVFVFTSSTSDYNAFESFRLGVTSYIRKQTSFEKFEKALLETDLYLKEYKVLVVEDNKDDAAIIFSELNNSSLKCTYEIATNKEEYKEALANFKPDIIFSDYDLPPKFDAIQAIHILQETDLKIPFILITGKLDEDLATSCLAEGMDDYLLKGGYKRFPVLFVNSLRKKKIEIEKLKAIESLKKSELGFREFFENAPEAIVILDADTGLFINFNTNAVKLLKYSGEELVKKSLADIGPSLQLDGISSKEKATELIMATMNGNKPIFEWLTRDANDHNFICEVRLVKLSATNVHHVYASFVDITDRKNVEAEKDKMTADLINRNKDLEQFSYIVSHNLRAPIGNISGAIALLNKKQLKDETKNILIKGLDRSAQKLDNIVKDLNSILQVKRELYEQKENTNFSEILNDIKFSLSQQIKTTKAEIKGNFEEINEIFILKVYLQSVFYNLISNSIKYRQLNVIPSIEIESHKANNKIELVFKDNGMGIDLATKREQVFGLYKRFHTHVEGKGMGLYMVKTQVEAMGGKISIQSEVNKGTEFKIEFPL